MTFNFPFLSLKLAIPNLTFPQPPPAWGGRCSPALLPRACFPLSFPSISLSDPLLFRIAPLSLYSVLVRFRPPQRGRVWRSPSPAGGSLAPPVCLAAWVSHRSVGGPVWRFALDLECVGAGRWCGGGVVYV